MTAEQRNLLNAIRMYDFYITELTMYLDTHPKCRRALDKFGRYTELRQKAYDAYAEKYGPITAVQSLASGGDCFKWVEDPFPWERSAN